MLFGLDAYLAIGGNLTPDFLKYNVLINEKERWGKIPLIKSKFIRERSNDKK